jgi:hypothetical protein
MEVFRINIKRWTSHMFGRTIATCFSLAEKWGCTEASVDALSAANLSRGEDELERSMSISATGVC